MLKKKRDAEEYYFSSDSDSFPDPLKNDAFIEYSQSGSQSGSESGSEYGSEYGSESGSEYSSNEDLSSSESATEKEKEKEVWKRKSEIKNPKVKTIWAHRFYINDIQGFFSYYSSLEKAHLNMSIDKKCIDVVIGMLKNNDERFKRLKEIYMQDNEDLGPEEFADLGRALETNTTLEKLTAYLNSYQYNSEAYESFFSSLKKNKTLKRLCIDSIAKPPNESNHKKNEENFFKFDRAIADYLDSSSTTLLKLTLRYYEMPVMYDTYFQDTDCENENEKEKEKEKEKKAVVKMWSSLGTNTTLQTLDLDHADVGDKIAHRIAKMLLKNTKLQGLRFGGKNYLSDRGIRFIMKALSKNRNTSLKVLKLYGKDYWYERTYLFQHQPEPCHFHQNTLLFAKMLSTNTFLKELDVSEMFLSTKNRGMQHLTKALCTNRSLKMLCADDSFSIKRIKRVFNFNPVIDAIYQSYTSDPHIHKKGRKRRASCMSLFSIFSFFGSSAQNLFFSCFDSAENNLVLRMSFFLM